MVDKVADVLRELESQLGIAVEYIWKALVKQSYVDGISSFIWGVVWLIVFILTIILAPRIFKKSNKSYEDAEDSDEATLYEFIGCAILIGSIAIVLISLPVSINMIVNGIKQFLNPDYYAIEKILSLVNGVVE